MLARVEHQRLKREYPAMFEDLAAYLYDQDPMGLNYGINPDEYESEVGTILPRVFEAETAAEIVGVIREEFERWFGPRLPIENATYEDLAAGIFTIINRYR
ncbi:MAG: hypothetical protein QOH21_911 [Acidobacteriota bacterium]|nr:hypothetical protein [Acidobacteriota bacterium]